MFYGWWVVTLAFIATAFGGATIWYGFTAFFDPLVAEFGWSYTAISLAASFRSMEVGLLGIFIGFIVDRFGSRRIIFVGSVLTGIGYILLSRVNSLAAFYALFLLIFIGSTGISSIIFFQAVTRWFRKRLGLALGIASAGYGAGGFAVPGIVYLIDLLGFRTVFIIIGIGAIVIGGLTSFFIRDRPEDKGLLPDGVTSTKTGQDTGNSGSKPFTIAEQTRSYSFREAISDPAFWILTYVSTMSTLSVMMVTTHVMPYLEHIGYARYTASMVAMMIPVTSIVGRLSLGWLSDITSRKVTFLLAAIGQTIGILLFLYANVSFALIIPFVVFYSISYGGIVVLRPVALRDIYGSAHIGSILGFSLGLSSLISLGGPLLGGWVFDATGSYDIAWLISSILVFVGIPLLPLMKSPPIMGKGVPPRIGGKQ